MRGDQTESREIYEVANRSANIQGLRSSTKSHNDTPISNTSRKNKLASKFEEPETIGVNRVNVFDSTNNIMIETIEVKINEVWKFDDLNPREPVVE